MIMNVKCPKCRYKFDVDIVVNDSNEVTCICPRCGNRFEVEPPEEPTPQSVVEEITAPVPQPQEPPALPPPVAEQPQIQQAEPEVQYVYIERDDDKPNRTPWIIAGVIAALLVLGGAFALWYNNEMTKRAELERQLAIQAEQARLDSIAEAEERERIRQDSIRQAQERERVENTRSAYIAQVDRYNDRYGDFYPNSYFLYDITGDGMPELWIQAGTCEADYEMHIYTVVNGTAQRIHSTDFSHASCYKGDDYIIIAHCHMGYAWWNKITYDGSKIVDKEVFTQELGEDEYDYAEPDGTPVIPYPQTEHEPINAYIK